MNERNKRLVEHGKSLLIVLLACSALTLAGQVFLSSESTSSVQEELLSPLPSAPAGQTTPGLPNPSRILLRNDNGAYGAQYDEAAVGALFDQVGSILGEALGSAAQPRPVSREDWEAALERTGVFLEFPGALPLGQSSLWLNAEENPVFGEHFARRLLLCQTPIDGTVGLYYLEEASEDYYACNTASLLRGRLDGYEPNGAFFAFQQSDRYDGLDGDTLLLSSPPEPPLYQSLPSLDLTNTAGRNALLRALAFSHQSNAIYPVVDGWSIRDGSDTLRLTDTGSVVFHSGGEEDPRYPLFREGMNGAMEYTAQLVAQAVAPYCGAAQVYLSGIHSSGETYLVSYSYALSGVPVQLGQENECARFTIHNGQITDYTLHLRRYEATGETAALLPEYQAMAAMEALDAAGQELLLRYYDRGSGTVAPSWIAR